jgi:hypothetical protein
MPFDKQRTERLRSFFEQLQRFGSASDVEGLARMYAPTIMIAGPNGAQVITAAALVQAIPQRKRLFEAAGHRKTTLTSIEPAMLTNRYSLVRTEWQWTFEHQPAGPVVVTLPSTFVVDLVDDAPQIVLYLMHEDVAAVLRQRGLLS